MEHFRTSLKSKLRAAISIFAYLFGTYCVYAVGTGAYSLHAALAIAMFLAAPLLAMLLPLPQPARVILAVAAIWCPFDFDLLTGYWPWPEGHGAYVLNIIMAVDLALGVFFVLGNEPIRTFDWRVISWFEVAKNFTIFFVIGVPIAIGIGFISWNPKFVSVGEFVLRFFGILLTIAIPEELLFRGILHRQLALWLKNLGSWVPLVLSSLIFGIAHLNNGPVQPNWAFAAMATLAGVFYCLPFRRTQSIMSGSIIHALVDAVWVTFFHISA